MSYFWQKMKVVEANSEIFTSMVFVFWESSPHGKEVSIQLWCDEFLNDFERRFLLDIGQRWVDSVQHPQNWSRKQIGLIQKIHSKVKQKNYLKKKGE